MSFGQEEPSESLRRSVLGLERRGIVLVAAGGNSGTGTPVDFPARYPEVVAVAASNQKDRVARLSNSGPEISLTAPGTRILSLALGGSTRLLSGTSMAAPHVTGSVALLRSVWPRLTPAQIRNVLMNTAEHLPGAAPNDEGAGLVRPDRALGL